MWRMPADLLTVGAIFSSYCLAGVLSAETHCSGPETSTVLLLSSTGPVLQAQFYPLACMHTRGMLRSGLFSSLRVHL